MTVPTLLIRLEVEALPRALVVAETREEELRLRAWLLAEPIGVAELLEYVASEPEKLFPWIEGTP